MTSWDEIKKMRALCDAHDVHFHMDGKDHTAVVVVLSIPPTHTVSLFTVSPCLSLVLQELAYGKRCRTLLLKA